MKTIEDLKPFASLLEREQCTKFTVAYPGPILEERRARACAVKVSIGKKFARVDVGDSGRYMVDLETGEIFGIKAYGVVHRGHRFGSLDTIHDWQWGGYRAVPAMVESGKAVIV